MDELVAFLLAGVALAGSPGPANLSLAAMGAAFGVRRSLAYQAGAIFGMLVIMAVTASGLAALVLAVPGLRHAVVAAALAYMLWLAWKIAAAPPRLSAAPPARPPSFAGGCLLQLSNPKAYAAMAALFSGFVLQANSPILDAAWKILLLLTIIAAVTTAWLHLGALLARIATRPSIQRAINVTFAILLLASVLVALLL